MRWEVDDRPATLYTRVYMAGMWLMRDKRAFEGAEHTLRIGDAQFRGRRIALYEAGEKGFAPD